jgi:hypothetical protein
MAPRRRRRNRRIRGQRHGRGRRVTRVIEKKSAVVANNLPRHPSGAAMVAFRARGTFDAPPKVTLRAAQRGGVMSTMSIDRPAGWALACVLLTGAPTTADALEQGPIDRVAVAQDFNERLDRYIAVRSRLEAPLPPLDVLRDPWTRYIAGRYLASAVRVARADARQGDIFSPPVASMLRQLIAEAIYALDVEGLADEDLTAPGTVVDLEVNETVPAWAMEDVPRALLERLPALPEGVEYRLVGGTLILWDAHAGILIDLLPGALDGL